jgi:hypothetical protein
MRGKTSRMMVFGQLPTTVALGPELLPVGWREVAVESLIDVEVCREEKQTRVLSVGQERYITRRSLSWARVMIVSEGR